MQIIIFLHIIAAIIFIGNIITAVFWKMRADYVKNPQHIHATAQNIMFADKVFTNPSIILLIATGLILGISGPYSMLAVNWLTISLALFIVMGVLFTTILTPIQKRLIRFSEENYIQEMGWTSYQTTSKQWAIVGSLLTIIPLIILFLMVVKPF